MEKLINLTPHDINLYRDGKLVQTLKSEGVARCSVESKKIAEINDYPIYENFFGEISGLPEPQKDTYFIVSRIVAEAAKNRTDLLIVDKTIRDENGKIIGCEGFAVLN